MSSFAFGFEYIGLSPKCDENIMVYGEPDVIAMVTRVIKWPN